MVRGVIEFAVSECMFAKRGTDQDEGRAGDFGCLHGGADVSKRPLDNQLIRPGRTIHNDHGAIRAVKRR